MPCTSCRVGLHGMSGSRFYLLVPPGREHIQLAVGLPAPERALARGIRDDLSLSSGLQRARPFVSSRSERVREVLAVFPTLPGGENCLADWVVIVKPHVQSMTTEST